MTQENKQLIKCHPFVEGSYMLELNEWRVLSAMLSKLRNVVKRDDLQLMETGLNKETLDQVNQLRRNLVTLTVSEFRELLPADKSGKKQNINIYQMMKFAADSIFEREVKISNPDGTLIRTRWVSSAYYDPTNSLIKLAFTPEVAMYMFYLSEYFTVYETRYLLQFKSKYTFRLYEIFKKWQKAKKKRFDYVELRYYLDLPESIYPAAGNFIQRILRPSMEEINLKSDISISYHPVKVGNKIVGFDFTIKTRNVTEGKAIQLAENIKPEKAEKPKNVVTLTQSKNPEHKSNDELLAVRQEIRNFEHTDEIDSAAFNAFTDIRSLFQEG